VSLLHPVRSMAKKPTLKTALREGNNLTSYRVGFATLPSLDRQSKTARAAPQIGSALSSGIGS
jgi:hypothetical protein